MMPLFQAMLDFDSSPETYERYDRMSALELFKQYGVSKRRAPARAPRCAEPARCRPFARLSSQCLAEGPLCYIQSINNHEPALAACAYMFHRRAT